MKYFFKDLIRRNVIRVGAIYIIIGWLLRRFTDFMVPVLGLPEFFATFVTVLILVGLPVCLAFSWAYDYTADGLELTKPATREELESSYNLSRTDFMLTGAMAFILAVVGIDTLMPATPVESGLLGNQTAALEEAAPADDAGDESSAASTIDPSIAVLPFVDLSPEQDQEYFSDGIAEEVLNSLVKVEGLKVAGRTSSFKFKGMEADTETIASTLNVAHILEGSVRKQGDRLRISVQLIQADTGFQRWSDTYNGSINEVFDVQEKIARAVADELEVLLTQRDAARLAKRRAVNDDAYIAYLRGRRYLGDRVGDSLPQAIEAFEAALELDPGYAPAWAGLSSAYALLPQYRVVIFAEAETAAEVNAKQALQLDPEMSEPHAVLGWIYLQQRNYVAMREQFDAALQIDPEDITANLWFGIGSVAVGDLDEANLRFSFVVRRDPVALVGLHMESLLGWMLGQKEEAEKRASRVYRIGYPPSGIQLGEIFGERGEIEKSRDYFAIAMRGMATRFSEDQRLVLGEGVFGGTEARAKALEFVESYIDGDGPKQELFIPYFLIHVGETEKAFSVYEQNRAAFDPLIYYGIWGPYGENARQHPDFPEFADRLGLTAYWRKYGWPDICATPKETSLPCS